MRNLKRLALFFPFLFLSCSKHLYVQQEWVNREYLASSWVSTPDYRQECPPNGQRLLIGWDYPRSIFEKKLRLLITVRFWDNTQKTFMEPIDYKAGSHALFFPNDDPERDRRILTYRILVKDAEDQTVEIWEHQFWTELISFDEEGR